jgi:phosphoribosylformimino-5-aminoimidazole carboxamide ribotide isomerase
VQCIFVFDILNGAVVHALRGERSRYKPVAEFSQVIESSDPLLIMDELRPVQVYVADLDMIMGSGQNLEIIDKISSRARTMADTGASRSNDLDGLPSSVLPVLGTETASISLMEEVSSKRRIIASLDMSNRRVLSRDVAMADRSPLEVLEELNHFDLEGVIIMELNRIGTSAGLDEEFLAEAKRISRHHLILGGGVKDEKDLEALEKIGFSGALVATAVHNGMIPLKRIQ